MDITGAAFVVMAAIICSVFGIPFTAAENEGKVVKFNSHVLRWSSDLESTRRSSSDNLHCR